MLRPVVAALVLAFAMTLAPANVFAMDNGDRLLDGLKASQAKHKKDDGDKKKVKKVAADENDGGKKVDDKSKKIPWNKTVSFNTNTKVYHLKGCKNYGGKNTTEMKYKEAKEKGGKACKKCFG